MIADVAGSALAGVTGAVGMTRAGTSPGSSVGALTDGTATSVATTSCVVASVSSVSVALTTAMPATMRLARMPVLTAVLAMAVRRFMGDSPGDVDRAATLGAVAPALSQGVVKRG